VGAFEEAYPSTESFWRAIILFGNNVASYKFALGKALLQLAGEGKTFVTLEELAVPFSANIVSHIKSADKQGQRPTGPFLDACRAFSRGEITGERLQSVTVSRGFDNVIDAFHTVNRAPTPTKFFVDERVGRGGISLTDDLLKMKSSLQYENLPVEVEARWKLVEAAWEMNIGRNLLQVEADTVGQLYVISRNLRRKAITSSRDALNGYQKGKCFYCFRDINIAPTLHDLAEVDHFYPWTLSRDTQLTANLNGVWNLVLACRRCNRGENGKFSQVPVLRYVERLERRNNFLIESHHPLRETLIAQTGASERERTGFLRARDREAMERLVQRWSAADEQSPAF
jgi:hypothetical protein